MINYKKAKIHQQRWGDYLRICFFQRRRVVPVESWDVSLHVMMEPIHNTLQEKFLFRQEDFEDL